MAPLPMVVVPVTVPLPVSVPPVTLKPALAVRLAPVPMVNVLAVEQATEMAAAKSAAR